jgi:hypothetical protein
MADSIRDLFFGAVTPGRELVEAVEPRRSFEDVVLPATTLRALNHALALVRKHDLIFNQWGLLRRARVALGRADLEARVGRVSGRRPAAGGALLRRS